MKRKKKRRKKESWQEIIETTIIEMNRSAMKDLVEDVKWNNHFIEARRRGLSLYDSIVAANQKALKHD